MKGVNRWKIPKEWKAMAAIIRRDNAFILGGNMQMDNNI